MSEKSNRQVVGRYVREMVERNLDDYWSSSQQSGAAVRARIGTVAVFAAPA